MRIDSQGQVFIDGLGIHAALAHLLKPDCGPVFRPLRNRKTFLSTMTVINGTLAFDVAGGRNDRKCVDIDPETIFEEGVTVASPY